jgi:adenosylhomocysteine nucleosidase
MWPRHWRAGARRCRGGPVSGRAVAGPAPGRAVSGPVPGRAVSGPIPGFTVGGRMPASATGGPIPGFAVGGPALGFVVGLAAEARIAARFGYPVLAGGGTPTGAAQAAMRLIGQGATALVSFGLAGGLDPALRPGTIVVPSTVVFEGDARYPDAALAELFGGLTHHTVLGGSSVAADTEAKRQLHTVSLAHAIDLESGPVARAAVASGIPFVVVRAICDPAERTLPPAALAALSLDGGISPGAVLRSVLAQPWQIPALLALGRDAARARRALLDLSNSFQARRPPVSVLWRARTP